MRIGIECLRADPHYVGGLNTYIFGLLDGFAAVGTHHRFQLYLTDDNRRRFARYEALENFEVVAFNGGWFRLRHRLCRAASLSRNREWYRRCSNGLFRSLRERMDS